MSSEIPKTMLPGLIAKIEPRACPCCGHSGFELHPRILAVPDGQATAGKARALVMLTCKGCQHVLFFSARGLGLVNQEPSGEPMTDN